MLWGKNNFSHLREVSSWILWSFVTEVLKLQNLKYHMLCVFHVLNFKRGEKSREGNQSVTTLMGSSEFNMRSLRRGIRAEVFKLNNIVWTLIIVKSKSISWTPIMHLAPWMRISENNVSNPASFMLIIQETMRGVENENILKKQVALSNGSLGKAEYHERSETWVGPF